MKTTSAKLVEGKVASAILDFISRSREISDGSGAPPPEFAHFDYISNSYLSELWRVLDGKGGFFGNQRFLKFGHELHKRDLKPKEKIEKLTADEEKLLKKMLARLAAETWYVKLKKMSKLEQISVEPIKVYGRTQMVKVILDIQNKKKGTDLKSTSCTSEKQFIQSAISYKYFKQSWLYSEAKQLDEFEFVGIGKKEVNGKLPLFRLPVNDFPDLMKEGMEQGKELISIHMGIKRMLKLTNK